MIKIHSFKDLSEILQKKRKESGLTQADAAALCGVGTRFLSELENGKETLQIGKVFKVIKGLGVIIELGARGRS